MSSHLAVVLLAGLAVVVLLARALGALARRCGQPAVVGELCAGILLGPTFFDGALSRGLFPAEVRPLLAALADVGLALFMFTVAVELDRTLLRGYGRVAGVVSGGSIAVSFASGAAAALFLATRYPTPERLGFVLFMGAAMSVTAFPVLARILADRDLLRTTLGGLALACAAVDDVLAWSLLAAVVAVVGAGGSEHLLLLAVIPYVLVVLLVVRPLLARLFAGAQRTDRLAVVVVGVLASAAFTEWIGLHFVFGAFLFGIAMPRPDTEQVREIVAVASGGLTSVLLLPIFFVVAGLHVDLSGVGSAGLVDLGVVLVAAIGGKFLGGLAAARLCHVHPRESVALAILMNTRGLTELVFLSVGLELGVLPPPLYSIMVVMALATTAMCGPLLTLAYPRPAPAREAALGTPARRPVRG